MPVDLLMSRGSDGYRALTDPHDFIRNYRDWLQKETLETDRYLKAANVGLENGQILFGTNSWVTQADIDAIHEENERWQRKIEARRLRRAEEKDENRRWRDIAAGRSVEENLAAVFKVAPVEIAALDEAKIEDFEARREGLNYVEPPHQVALGLARHGKKDTWVIDSGSIDGWENFGIHALAEDETVAVYWCDVDTTMLKTRYVSQR